MRNTFDQYRCDLDSLQFSDEALARMTTRLTNEFASVDSEVVAAPTATTAINVSRSLPSKTHRIRRPGSSPKRTAHRALRVAASLAIAMGLALGATGAYAAATQRSLPAIFSDIFGGAPAQAEIINNIGHPIGASATSNGVTVTADAIIGSANSCTMVFSVARDDGKPLELPAPAGDATYPLLWATGDIQIDGTQGLSSGSYFYDADPTDNSIQYVCTINNATTFDGNSLSGRTARVHLSNLSAAYEQASDTTVIAEGSWDLKFQLNYQDSSVALQADQKLELNGMEVTVDKLSVSPIGASITYTVDAVSSKNQSPTELPSDKFAHLPFTVTFKDRRIADGTDADASTRERSGRTTVTKSFVFNTITDMDDIASVTVGDQAVPIR